MIVAAAAMMITACQQAEMEAEADTDTAEPVVLTLANNLPSVSYTHLGACAGRHLHYDQCMYDRLCDAGRYGYPGPGA